MAFNDTHTFGSGWLNEFRFGWSSIEFLMTPIDYGQNLAEKMGIPGVNLNQSTSAMSQITFNQGGSRNLGSNGNQPLITNQNDFQIFDNVTWIKGRHLIKAGGSLDIALPRDPERRPHRRKFPVQPGSDLELRGAHDGLHAQRVDRIRRCELPARLRRSQGPAAVRCIDDTEKRPEWAAYVQDDFRLSQKLTLNLGLRWDMFVPWVEIDDRQSNRSSTGKFVLASDDTVIDGVNVGRYLQTYSKTDLRTAPGLGL